MGHVNGISANSDIYYNLIGREELSDAERKDLGAEMFTHRSRHRTPIRGFEKTSCSSERGAAASVAVRTSTNGPWR